MQVISLSGAVLPTVRGYSSSGELDYDGRSIINNVIDSRKEAERSITLLSTRKVSDIPEVWRDGSRRQPELRRALRFWVICSEAEAPPVRIVFMRCDGSNGSGSSAREKLPRSRLSARRFVDFDINEALAMQKNVSPYMWEICNSLSHNYDEENRKEEKKYI